MRNYSITDLPDYFKQYKKSIKNPKKFWDKIADENFVWYQRWTKVVEFDMEEAKIKWFKNAKLNITKNCLDRHLSERGDKTAIIWEPNDPQEEAQYISYRELQERVCKMANVLTDLGIKKGDRVCIYLPMIPELAVAMLACAKMGAVHSVIFAGFSATAVESRVNDCGAKIIITSDGSYRGNKAIDLKGIIDEAAEKCPTIEKILVVKRTNTEVKMKEGRDVFLSDLWENASSDFVTKIMDAEDPLFILYTSGSTGKPKGMLHTNAGYMVYTAYTFKNVFNYQENDVYWCTADIGWITGHSYIVYGPLLNGATTVIFEGVPTYPQPDRFWEVIEKHRVNQFYTAPTAIRSLAKESYEWVEKHDLSSLKVIGSVGEPINDEAWHWYNDHVGQKKCPVVDTWWRFPWPGIARTIWGDHQRYKETYFTAFPGKYFTGDGALRDEVGYYRITGRVDDVIIVSGHNLGTAPIEDSINLHPAVAESAIVGYPHDIKGNALYGYVILKETGEDRNKDNLRKEINQLITETIGPISKLDKIQFVSGLPKTRSGKIMRRILRKIAEGDFSNFGDTSTLLNPEIVDEIKNERI